MELYRHGARHYRTALLALSIIFSASTSANVVMTGTRIIYDGAAKSADVQLRNRADFPYVVSTWFDNGNPENGPDESFQVPFIATPPLTRVLPGKGQVIRVMFTGNKTLPQDRESVFYFNFMQVPPSDIGGVNDSGGRQNNILIMLRNRVKLFYRPAGLAGNPKNILKNIQVSKVTENGKHGITIKNNQPYHVTVVNVKLDGNKQNFVPRDGMIAPFTRENFVYPGMNAAGAQAVHITLVNDQGARISERYPL